MYRKQRQGAKPFHCYVQANSVLLCFPPISIAQALNMSLLDAFTSEFIGPVFVALDILCRDGWPCTLNGTDEIFELEIGLDEIVRFDFRPRHFHCAMVAW